MTAGQPIHLTEIVKGQLYLGNLSAAFSAEQKAKFGITHIVSVCPDYPSTGPNHLTVTIEDSEYDVLLDHLPRICDFIEEAVRDHGRVLVHCVMGISRSASAVAAYLMKSRGMSVPTAIAHLKHFRPIVHPNYGFIRQLYVFAECGYQPSPSHPRYLSWWRKRKQDVKCYISFLEDTFPLVHNKVLLTCEYPQDYVQAQSYILDLAVTKVVSIEPAQLPSTASFAQYERFQIADSTFDSLNSVCCSIRESIEMGGQVLLYCESETKLCMAACAFLMFAQGLSMHQALARVEDVVPLFEPTPAFLWTLEGYAATAPASPKKSISSGSHQLQRNSILGIDFSKTSIDRGVNNKNSRVSIGVN